MPGPTQLQTEPPAHDDARLRRRRYRRSRSRTQETAKTRSTDRHLPRRSERQPNLWIGYVSDRRRGDQTIRRRVDPQLFDLDEAESMRSLFSGLAASGWHTAAITMRLLVGSVRISGGIVGAGMDVLRWPTPVRPGDTLRLECEVLEVRPSTSHPDRGLAKVRTTTLNQHGETVQVLVANLVVPRRPRDEAGVCALAPAHPRSQ